MNNVEKRKTIFINATLAGVLLLSLGAQPAASQTNVPPQPQSATEPAKQRPAKPAPAKSATQAKPNSAAAQPSTSSSEGRTATVETTQFQNWTVTCENRGDAAKPLRCVARINVLRSKDDPRPILFGYISTDGASWRMALQVPTSTVVKPGVQLAIGKRAPRQFEIISCEPALCSAEGPLDASGLEELKSSKSATVNWSTIGLGEAKVEFALDGIAPAIALLEKR